MSFQKAQKALDAHPLAKKAFVNEAGEWFFSTPPKDFVTVETLTKSEVEVKVEENSTASAESKHKGKRK